MNKFLPLIGAILLLAVAYYSGYSKYLGLAWYPIATLVGGVIGSIVALALIWYRSKNAKITHIIEIVLGVAFVATIAFTHYNARIFIDSADFERVAGYNWYLGYHAGVALFIPFVAAALHRILARKQAK